MISYSKLLSSLVKKLNEEESEMFVKSLLVTLQDIGIEHNNQCLSVRPHSHSCDCDCGAEELSDKIFSILGEKQ